MRDVLVIGIGTSGLTAALRCQEAGLTVTLLAKGVGSTHLAPSTIDVLGYDPELVENPSEALLRLIERIPSIPTRASEPGPYLDHSNGSPRASTTTDTRVR